jgi:hypothetical protein
MKDYLARWHERYAKVLRDYPELKEASNLSAISAYAASDRNEQKLQQEITAALICDNPYTYEGRNIMEYNLETCNTPTDRTFYTDSSISWELGFMFRYLRIETIYRIEVERLEQIYFTL